MLKFFCNELGIAYYKQYFGLMYCDNRSGEMIILDENDVLKKLDGKKITFHVVTSFHPENPDEVFQSAPSRRLFCDLMKDKLVSGELGCDVDTHAYLDAMYLQAIIGDYRDGTVGKSYSDEIRSHDIFTPTYLNCGSCPKESIYISKVKRYHRENIGIERDSAERLYLAKIKTLPFYPFKLYRHVKTNGHQVTVGLTTKGLYLIADSVLEQFLEPSILAEYLWSDVRYCTIKKHKLHVSVFVKSELDEIILKVRRPDIERIFNDISKLRERLTTNEGSLQKRPCQTVGAVCGEVFRKTFKLGPSRQISNFTLSVENSFTKLRERTLTGTSTNGT